MSLRATTSSPEEAYVTITCGRLLRRQVRRLIEREALGRGLEVGVSEDKGLLDSQFLVHARGDGAGDFIRELMSIRRRS